MGYEVLIINLLLLVVSVALQMSAQPKADAVAKPEAGKLDIPRVDEGVPISVIFGTVLKKDSNCVWYGDAATVPIVSRSGSSK